MEEGKTNTVYVYGKEDTGSLKLSELPNGKIKVSLYIAYHNPSNSIEVDGGELEEAIGSLGAFN
jgi:hypothetical protein